MQINPNIFSQSQSTGGAQGISTASPEKSSQADVGKLGQAAHIKTIDAPKKEGVKRKVDDIKARLSNKLPRMSLDKVADKVLAHSAQAIKNELAKLENKFGQGSLKADSELFQEVKGKVADFKDKKAVLDAKMAETYKTSFEGAMEISKEIDNLEHQFNADNASEPNKSIVDFLKNNFDKLPSSTMNKAFSKISAGASQTKAQIGALNSNISSTLTQTLNASANKVFENLQKALTQVKEATAAKESPNAKEVSGFLGSFDKQIAKEESKLASLTTQHEAATGQDKEDLGNSVKQLKETVTQMKAIRAEVDKSGTKYLSSMRKNQGENIATAKQVATDSIKSGEKYAAQFEDLAKQLIGKTTEKGSPAETKLESHLETVSKECKENLEACKEREPHAELWGLLGSWKLNEGKLSSDQNPSVIHMNAKVISPSRLNSGELMPNFIESFHKDVLMGDMAKGLDLKRPGAGDLSNEQIKENQTKFEAFTGETAEKGTSKADALNKAYGDLTSAYKGRSADPKKYMDEAAKFVDLFKSI